jgi:hypothetical protein
MTVVPGALGSSSGLVARPRCGRAASPAVTCAPLALVTGLRGCAGRLFGQAGSLACGPAGTPTRSENPGE